MACDAAVRFQTELDLLFAMYPNAVAFSSKARELQYVHPPNSDNTSSKARLLLRIPDTYPVFDSAEIISATGPQKEDLRTATRAMFESLNAPAGEEVLDVLLLAFQEVVSLRESAVHGGNDQVAGHARENEDISTGHKTVIIWLHHLLNTNKRKLALNPSRSDSNISGITKPGYPGVLIYSGPKAAADAHVSELRSQKWQAFQVRYNSEDVGKADSRWNFKHGLGIHELESMSDVARDISDAKQREIFLSAIGVK
ncbi:hypothetical protein F4779DRAFT_259959 [Xylariaceae sp. FL0662B]|nr:hypothetical protein F4779DRAFT_259959 [Xylariaceae sp. FL0662B]